MRLVERPVKPPIEVRVFSKSTSSCFAHVRVYFFVTFVHIRVFCVCVCVCVCVCHCYSMDVCVCLSHHQKLGPMMTRRNIRISIKTLEDVSENGAGQCLKEIQFHKHKQSNCVYLCICVCVCMYLCCFFLDTRGDVIFCITTFTLF